jgi:hypothetical protein
MLPGELSDPPQGYLERRIALPDRLLMYLVGPLRSRGILAQLAEFDEALAIAKEPWPAKLAASADFWRRYHSGRDVEERRGRIEIAIGPYGNHGGSGELNRFVLDGAETLARTRASIAAVAVARYQRANHEQLPPTLDDLVPAFLPAPPLDPYTGTPLVYHADGDTYKVYSLGVNLQDDGGTWDTRADVQPFRRGNPKDVGIAVHPWH